jgi:hypothetical protein
LSAQAAERLPKMQALMSLSGAWWQTGIVRDNRLDCDSHMKETRQKP